MDSFFVEVERVRDPSLRGRPVAVGGVGPRGVIASASYEAREFGVRSAQPTRAALGLCPMLEVVPPSHGRYGEVSAQVFEIFRSITPIVEGLSVDEAFLDVSGLRHHFDSPSSVAAEIRREVRDRLSLPSSVGIAATKFVAKLASAAAKPDGVLLGAKEDALDFIHALPIEELWGVGPATLASMQRLGVERVGDLAELPESVVLREFGPATGRHLLDLAAGVDPRPVEPDDRAKSISVEETYSTDLEGRGVVETGLLAHAQRLSGRLRRSGVKARTITLKVRFEDFVTITRSTTVPSGIDTPRLLHRVALQLLDQVDELRPVRLLGLGGSSLMPTESPVQTSIDEEEDWERVADAVTRVRARYGEHAVEPASLMEERNPDSKAQA